MIERQWKGIAKPWNADNYVKHLLEETFPKLEKINGFIRASILKRPVGDNVEFLVITVWDSIEAIKKFAGEQFDVAVVPEIVQKLMIEYDDRVAHYEILREHALVSGRSQG